MITPTHMAQEIAEIPLAISRLLEDIHQQTAVIAGEFRAKNPKLIATIARGSSDHAAHFLKYAFEIETGIPVVSLGPSLSSQFGVQPKLMDALAIAISQSGKSPDIVSLAKAGADAGALSVAIVNSVPSPLADVCDHVLDIKAGHEQSVAATKSFVNSIVTGLALLASVQKDDALWAALLELPKTMQAAINSDWQALSDGVINHKSMFVLGRGPSLAIAHESALKMKETCSVHAEAYSAAEVLHGPVELVEKGFPVLVFDGRGRTQATTLQIVEKLVERGGKVFLTGTSPKDKTTLPVPQTGHSLCDALVQIACFYQFAEKHARRLDRNPDEPKNLKKITETI